MHVQQKNIRILSARVRGFSTGPVCRAAAPGRTAYLCRLEPVRNHWMSKDLLQLASRRHRLGNWRTVQPASIHPMSASPTGRTDIIAVFPGKSESFGAKAPGLLFRAAAMLRHDYVSRTTDQATAGPTTVDPSGVFPSLTQTGVLEVSCPTVVTVPITCR